MKVGPLMISPNGVLYGHVFRFTVNSISKRCDLPDKLADELVVQPLTMAHASRVKAC